MQDDKNAAAFPERRTPPTPTPSLADFIAERMSRDYQDADVELAPGRYIGGHGEDWRQK